MWPIRISFRPAARFRWRPRRHVAPSYRKSICATAIAAGDKSQRSNFRARFPEALSTLGRLRALVSVDMGASQTISVGPLSVALASGAANGAGCVTAFRRLMERVWSDQVASLAALAAGLGLRREQAADVLQDVYLTALRHPPTIDTGSELTRWLFRVTANRCRLEHRQRGRWQRLWRSLAGAWPGGGWAGGVPLGGLAVRVGRDLG